MIDAHAHLMDYSYEYSPSVAVINTGYDLYTSKKAIASIKQNIWAVVGISPQKSMRKIDYKELNMLRILGRNAIGIGEIGLDYHWGREEWQRRAQEKWFLEELSIAQELELPIVIHARDAIDRVIDLVEKIDIKGVMFHFYSGETTSAKRILDNNWYISIPPLRSKKRKKVILNTPLENLITETDSPYVGKTCEDVQISTKYIGEIKDLGFNEVEKVIEKNVRRLFNI